MSPRSTLRAVAALFVVAGLFLLRLATFDPMLRVEVERIRGSLARVDFRATPRLGEVCLVTLTPGSTTFALQQRLDDDSTLRSELATRLIPGVAVEVDSPVEDARPGAQAGSAGPRPINRLTANGALIFDLHARRGQAQGLLRFALGVAAALAVSAGIGGLLLAGRVADSLPSA